MHKYGIFARRKEIKRKTLQARKEYNQKLRSLTGVIQPVKVLKVSIVNNCAKLLTILAKGNA